MKLHWIGVLACLVLVACSKPEQPELEQASEVPAEPQGWATVNGSELTDAEFEAAVDRFFGDQLVDARALHSLRESLIASRALAQAAEQEISASELESIELATRAYREERLIAAYLDQSTTPQPVSSQQVQTYYQAHLEDFGAATVKQLEMLRIEYVNAGLSAADAATLLGQAPDQQSWDSWADSRAGSGVQSLTIAANDQLPVRLRAAVSPLDINQVSGVIVDGDIAYRVRVSRIDDIPAKPLAEVSGEIRRRLAASQLKDSISTISDDVLRESTIERRYD